MKTKLVMGCSALFFFLAALSFSFFSAELLDLAGLPDLVGLHRLFIPVSAVYFGFALLNWTARKNLIGSIYSRPIALGNFIHFAAGSLGLIKICLASHYSGILWTITIIFFLFATLFGLILFGRFKNK